jgi:hypothetical protein
VKTGSAETPQRGLRQLAAPEECAALPSLVSRETPVRDLLLRAKHLSVAATTGASCMGRQAADLIMSLKKRPLRR